MKSNNIIIVLITVLIFVFIQGCIDDLEINVPDNSDASDADNHLTQNISIACWNLQIFGPSKASNQSLLNYYTEKLDDYDIFILQEIRDASGIAIETLAEKFPEYQYIISNRAGQSSSKEQYIVFYNNQATLVDSYDYQVEYQEVMQRPPLKVTFISNNWTFTLITIHTQPDNVAGELSVLQTIVDDPLGDTIILGDLNADGSYYDEDNIQHFTDWSWVVTNNVDTTVAPSDNTYDRIIINKEVENNFLSFGIMDNVKKEQSDHYLIYGSFSNEEE